MRMTNKEALKSEAAQELLRRHAEVCKALGSEQRGAIICALRDRELTVGELADRLDLSIQHVSQHLRVLKDSRLVQARRDGRHVYYSVTNPKFFAACCLIRDALIEDHEADGKGLAQAGRALFGRRPA